MAVKNIAPPPYLAGLVRNIWFTDFKMPNDHYQSIRILANGSPGLIFQHAEGHSAVKGAGGNLLPLAFIYGQSTVPCVNQMIKDAIVCGFEFYPSALKNIFGIDAAILTDALVELEHLLSKEIIDQLINCPNIYEVIQLLCVTLAKQSASFPFSTFVEESILLITQSAPQLSPAALPQYFHISQRQFQRKFKERIGVCPETYIRITKFQQSIHWLQNKKFKKIGDISYALGYTDQAYFNREFKFFSGYTPKEFMKVLAKQQFFYRTPEHTVIPLRILTD